MRYDICVIGGFGHVGLPLSIAFADRGLNVCAFDISRETYDVISSGKMPFLEYGAEEVLGRVLAGGKLTLSFSPDAISAADALVVVVGTPVDRHLNPEFEELRKVIDSYLPYFRDGQLLVLRSTVYPGTTEKIYHFLKERGRRMEVSFCPERIAEGYAMKELFELPQIVSSFTAEGMAKASDLFRVLAPEIIELLPIEAELAKLFTNSWRYIKFSVANQFFMTAGDCDADYYRIHHAITHHYPRAQDLPLPGFAAGPCLFKDTVQLSAFNNHTFYLGHAALLINEGLPYYLVSRLKRKYDLKTKTVGILGMAFKADVDDRRESLSFKLKKILEFESGAVLCSDVYIKERGFVGADELIGRSDIIILACPHKEYGALSLPAGKPVIDVWNVYGKGSCL
ncbi:MAG: nucleotide sugar dehydrogenase [Nitrospiraceae bacterium]|nr:nucleotide sugar dehydrogenase [Nitrospiraceae bacterium]